MAIQKDVLVIGNGAIGLSVALALSRIDPTQTIGVIAPRARPHAASPAAGAMHGAFGEITTELVRTELGRKKLALDLEARELWPAWLEALNEGAPAADRVESRPGTFVIGNTVSGTMEEANLDAMIAELDRRNEPYELVAPRLVPGVNAMPSSRPTRAVFLPREGSVDAGALLRALERALERQPNVTFWDEPASALLCEKRRIRGVRIASGPIEASTVVLAAGVGCRQLLESIPELAFRVPRLVCGAGTSVLVETAPSTTIEHVIRTPNRSFACGRHVVPRGGRQLYVGATNNVGLEPEHRPPVQDMALLIEAATQQIDSNLAYARLVQWMAGNRPISVDLMPLVGATTTVDGLWIMTGTYRDGLHQSPLLAQHVARSIAGKPGLIDDTFRPEREPLCVSTTEEAIAETLAHIAGMQVEHSLYLPYNWHKPLARNFERSIRTLYQELDAPYVLPPELSFIIDKDQATLASFRSYYRKVHEVWHS